MARKWITGASLSVLTYTMQALPKLLTDDTALKLTPRTPLPVYRMDPFKQFEQRNLFTLAHIFKVDKKQEIQPEITRRLELSCMKLRLQKKRFTYILCLKY